MAETIVMTRPDSGDRYDIPVEKVSEALKGGLVLTAPMVDAKGNVYDIPLNKTQEASKSGLKRGPGFEHALNIASVPRLDEKGHVMEDPNDTRPKLEDMGSLERIWHDMNQGGPADWRNILNAIGPVAATVQVPAMGIRNMAGGATVAKASELADPTTLQVIGSSSPAIEAAAKGAAVPVGMLQKAGGVAADIGSFLTHIPITTSRIAAALLRRLK